MKLKLENMECIDSNGADGGDFELTLYCGEGTLIVLARVTHDHDEYHFSNDATLLTAYQYDGNDEPIPTSVSKKEIEEFVESDIDVENFFQNRLDEIGEESRLEHALNQLEEENWFLK